MAQTKIGILTGGGDCPGLNAVIRAVVKSATRLGWETYGIHNGYEGLLEPVSCSRMDHRDMGALLTSGGTVLGTTNKGRFVAKTGHGEKVTIPEDILNEAKRNFVLLGLEALGVRRWWWHAQECAEARREGASRADASQDDRQ